MNTILKFQRSFSHSVWNPKHVTQKRSTHALNLVINLNMPKTTSHSFRIYADSLTKYKNIPVSNIKPEKYYIGGRLAAENFNVTFVEKTLDCVDMRMKGSICVEEIDIQHKERTEAADVERIISHILQNNTKTVMEKKLHQEINKTTKKELIQAINIELISIGLKIRSADIKIKQDNSGFIRFCVGISALFVLTVICFAIIDELGIIDRSIGE